MHIQNYEKIDENETKVVNLENIYPEYFYIPANNGYGRLRYVINEEGKALYLIQKSELPNEIKSQLKGGEAGKGTYEDYVKMNDVYGVTSDLKVYYAKENGEILGIGKEILDNDDPIREVVSEEIKTEILKHDKEADTVLEEKGHEHILEKVKEPAIKESSESDFSNLGIEVEENYNIEEVVADVTAYVQIVVDEMDVDATISSSHNRRTVNMQIDTNEPGRVIGYHGKVLKALQLLAQNYLYNRYSKNFYITINVNDYVEHRAEVLQSYAQKLATRALEDGQAQQTDPMSNSERKIIHRIVSKMEGVTSYSEGEEPNRYVVVDIEG